MTPDGRLATPRPAPPHPQAGTRHPAPGTRHPVPVRRTGYPSEGRVGVPGTRLRELAARLRLLTKELDACQRAVAAAAEDRHLDAAAILERTPSSLGRVGPALRAAAALIEATSLEATVAEFGADLYRLMGATTGRQPPTDQGLAIELSPAPSAAPGLFVPMPRGGNFIAAIRLVGRQPDG